MMIKIFAHSQGSGSGPVDYLLNRNAPLRDLAPPEVLGGCPTRTKTLIDSLRFKHRYTSGVFSFAKEDRPSEAQQRALMAEFENTAFAGLLREHYDILWVRHRHLDRVELHFVAPRIDLVTGQSLNLAPPGWETIFYCLRDAWNFENGWARPDDPARARDRQPGHVAAIEAAAFRQNVVSSPDPREAIHQYLCGRIASGQLTDRAAIVLALQEAGFEITRTGTNYITIKEPASDQRFRLKGTIYEQQFSADFSRTNAAEDRSRSNRDTAGDTHRAAEARDRLRERMEKRAHFNRERVARWLIRDGKNHLQ
jgi:hypothetical protein